MKPTIELNKEQFMDRIERELDFNETAINMVDRLWDDMEGKSVSVTSRVGLDAYYPAFFDEFLEIVYGDDIEDDDICRVVKENSNYEELWKKPLILNKAQREYVDKICNVSKIYKELGDDTIKKVPWRIVVKTYEDKLNPGKYDLEIQSIDGKWLIQDSITKKQFKDIVKMNNEISHISDDQELSVEEVDSYLETCGLYNGLYDALEIHTEDGRNLEIYAGHPSGKMKLTKANLKQKLEELAKIYSSEEKLQLAQEGEVDYDVSAADVEKDFDNAVECLEKAIDDFDEKFDKCVTKYRAKQTNKEDFTHPEHEPVQSNNQVANKAATQPAKKKI